MHQLLPFDADETTRNANEAAYISSLRANQQQVDAIR